MLIDAVPLKSTFGRKHRAAAFFGAAATRELLFHLRRVASFQNQTVVVVQFFTRRDVAQCTHENSAAYFFSLAICLAAVVDPLGCVAAMLAVDDMRIVDMKVKGVIGIFRVMRMPKQCLGPGDDLAGVLDDALALGERCRREHPRAVDARGSYLDASRALFRGEGRRAAGDTGLRHR